MAYRKTANQTILKILRELGKGKYTRVYRGALDWTTFDFSAHPFAASLFVPDYRVNYTLGVVECVVTVDLFASETAGVEGADDEVLDVLHEDADALINQMRAARDARNDSVFMRVQIINIVEAAFPATEHKPHGLLVNLDVTY